MYVDHSLNKLAERADLTDVVVACGVFDGIHRGHQLIIERLQKLAGRNNAHAVIVTFDPHPRAVLYPDEPPQYLTTKEQKIRIFRQLGVEGVVILPFSRLMADMSPRNFLARELLQQGPRVRGVCVGEDWRFGRGSENAGVELLHEAGKQYGFEVDAVPPFFWYRYPISSTRIRKAIAAARLPHAARMLNRPHTVRGTVETGIAEADKSLQCPTANLADPLIMLPPAGVYAARANLNPDDPAENSCGYNGIVYIGKAPTFASKNTSAAKNTTVELHIFDFDENLYDRVLEIELHGFIRGSIRFDSPDSLKAQIERDITTVQSMLYAIF